MAPRKPHRLPQSIILSLYLLISISLHPVLSLRNDSYGFQDPRFIYSPPHNWSFDYQNGIAYTNSSGASITTSFFGSAIYLSSSKRADRYLLQVTIDDQDYDVDLNGPDTTESPPQILWGTTFLFEGNHTFRAVNKGADPSRPWVAFASITVTIGQQTNPAPPVSSTPFHSLGELEDDHTERNSIIRRVGAAIGAVISFLVLVFLGYRLQRRRHLRQLDQYLHDHRAHPPATPLKARPPNDDNIALSSNLSQVDNPNCQHRYSSIHNSHKLAPTYPPSPKEPTDSLLVVSEDPIDIVPCPSKESDDSEFWRPRSRSTR